MARGRMIVNEITKDKKISQLIDDTSRLAFTWLITFADAEGRTFGDPAVVKAMLFPRREDITVIKMEEYIRQWHELGLIIWYEANDDRWISFPKFTQHNWVNKNREAKSKIPAPTPELVQSNSGVVPDKLPVKVKVKVKVNNKDKLNTNQTTKEDDDVVIGEVFKLFEDNICLLTPLISDQLRCAIDEYGGKEVIQCIKIASENNGRSIRYVTKVLENRKNGIDPRKRKKSRDTEESRKRYGEWEE